eukprot:7937493-Alexandrium_andersonii.AAC.1
MGSPSSTTATFQCATGERSGPRPAPPGAWPPARRTVGVRVCRVAPAPCAGFVSASALQTPCPSCAIRVAD